MNLTDEEATMLRQLLAQATVTGVEDAKILVSLAEKLLAVEAREEGDDGKR